MDRENIFNLMEELKNVSIFRKRIRRILFRALRLYYHQSRYRNYKVDRKIRNNFLTDFSDNRIISELGKIYDGLPDNLKQEWGERS